MTSLQRSVFRSMNQGREGQGKIWSCKSRIGNKEERKGIVRMGKYRRGEGSP